MLVLGVHAWHGVHELNLLFILGPNVQMAWCPSKPGPEGPRKRCSTVCT